MGTSVYPARSSGAQRKNAAARKGLDWAGLLIYPASGRMTLIEQQRKGRKQ